MCKEKAKYSHKMHEISKKCLQNFDFFTFSHPFCVPHQQKRVRSITPRGIEVKKLLML